MSGWRTTKDGKHFKLGSKPGINSNHNNHSHSGSQPSSMQTERRKKSCRGCGIQFTPTLPNHVYCNKCGLKHVKQYEKIMKEK